jgi:hypothetical protein
MIIFWKKRIILSFRATVTASELGWSFGSIRSKTVRRKADIESDHPLECNRLARGQPALNEALSLIASGINGSALSM